MIQSSLLQTLKYIVFVSFIEKTFLFFLCIEKTNDHFFLLFPLCGNFLIKAVANRQLLRGHVVVVIRFFSFVSKLQTTVSKLQTTVFKPQATVSKSRATVSKPQATVSKSQTTVSKPQATVSKSQTTVSKP